MDTPEGDGIFAYGCVEVSRITAGLTRGKAKLLNILVTGGAGYIGSHVCKALSKRGFFPVVYDSLIRGHRSLVKWGDLVCADIRDRRALQDAFERYKPAAVLHFAALAYVGESVTEPAPYFEVNTGGTIQLLSVMLDYGVKRIVFSSSCATYGIPAFLPIIEGTPQAPTNPYGHSKLFIEDILQAYSQAYGFRAIILRYFNACGADPEGEIGEIHQPEPHLVPRCLMAASGSGEMQLEIYGTDYATRDGTCVRDYIHVSDLADAHLAALEYLLDGGNTVALNLGIGCGFTVREVIRSVERITNRTLLVQECSRRAGDPPELIADSSLARTVLSLQCHFSDLDEMIQTAWEWHQKRIS
jgi:UDP-glucose-4-epimerase GalE